MTLARKKSPPWASSVTGKQEANQMLILYLRPAGAWLDSPAGP